MLKQILLLVLVTLIPALELRASIPFGIMVESERWGITPGLMAWPVVVLVCVIANILLGFAVFWVLAPILHWLERFAWFRRWFVGRGFFRLPSSRRCSNYPLVRT